MNETSEPNGELMLRVVARPADVNVNGDIFGGWVLSQMDIAAGILSRDVSGGRSTTVAVDAMKFIRPVKIGDILCVYARLLRIGRSSMAIAIEAWVRRDTKGTREKVTEAVFTFVAIDDEGRPRAVPEQEG
jgi:acyl-CoA thioesterase YciA